MPDLGQLMDASAERVLETMFFTGLLGPVEAVEPEGQIAARVPFQGRPSGTFSLSISGEQAREMACGFLGLDAEELTPSRVEEVVAELANMICGSLLSKLDSDSRFDLMSPAVAPAEKVLGLLPEEPARAGEVVRRSHEMENGTITLMLETREAP